MVLSNRLGTKTPRSLFQRTLLYVFGFGTGSLLIAATLSFAFVSLAEGAFTAKKPTNKGSDAVAGQPVRIIGGPKDSKASKANSQKRPTRGNEARGAGKNKAAGPL